MTLIACNSNNNNGETESSSLLPEATRNGNARRQEGALPYNKRAILLIVALVLSLLGAATMVYPLKSPPATVHDDDMPIHQEQVDVDVDDDNNKKHHEDDNTVHEWWWEHDNIPTTTTYLPGDISIHNLTSLRWGILGLGRIARDFCTALKMTKSNITAVAAGSLPNSYLRAQQFANVYNISTYYGSYSELADDPNVDIVYIATTNQLHFNTTVLMLRANKHVLVEKPMAVTLQEARRMQYEAQKHDRLLVTNFWTHFFPIVKYVKAAVKRGQLGSSVTAMHGDFGFTAWPDASSRLLNKTLGGGVMLDLGCYLVSMAVSITAERSFPMDIQATGLRSYLGVDYNVDTEAAFGLRWGGTEPAVSSLKCRDRKEKRDSQHTQNETFIMSGQASFRRPSSFAVEIAGTHGRVVIRGPANAPEAAAIYQYEPFGSLQHVEIVKSNIPDFLESYGREEYPQSAGFVYIIQALERCMNKNNGACLELEELTNKEQLTTVKITDQVLRKIGYWKSQSRI